MVVLKTALYTAQLNCWVDQYIRQKKYVRRRIVRLHIKSPCDAFLGHISVSQACISLPVKPVRVAKQELYLESPQSDSQQMHLLDERGLIAYDKRH
jgi:hypothetical protein